MDYYEDSAEVRGIATYIFFINDVIDKGVMIGIKLSSYIILVQSPLTLYTFHFNTVMTWKARDSL